MKLVNKEAFQNIKGNAKKGLENAKRKGYHFAMISLATLMMSTASIVPTFAYSYVPYNASWGTKDVEQTVEIAICKNDEQVGVVNLNNAGDELKRAVYRCLDKQDLDAANCNIVTCRILYPEDSPVPVIDTSSFSPYGSSYDGLRPLKAKKVTLHVYFFISPEGQKWTTELNYRNYAEQYDIVYECSDGSVVHSYVDFKMREKKLGAIPQNKPENNVPSVGPNINNPSGGPGSTSPVGPGSTTPSTGPLGSSVGNSLKETIYTEYSADGTIWINQTILSEYLQWLRNKSYGMQNGVYVGSYGTASSFEEYVRIYNVAYFVNNGLASSEQYYGAYGFLYSSAAKAQESLQLVNGYQLVK